MLKTTNGGDNRAEVAVGGAMNTSGSCAVATDNIGVVVGNGGFVSGTTNGLDSNRNTGYLIGNDTVEGVVRYTNDIGASLRRVVKHFPKPDPGP